MFFSVRNNSNFLVSICNLKGFYRKKWSYVFQSYMGMWSTWIKVESQPCSRNYWIFHDMSDYKIRRPSHISDISSIAHDLIYQSTTSNQVNSLIVYKGNPQTMQTNFLTFDIFTTPSLFFGLLWFTKLSTEYKHKWMRGSGIKMSKNYSTLFKDAPIDFIA